VNSYNQFAAVTPSNTLDGPFTSGTPTPNLFAALYVGGTGDIAVVDQSGNVTIFTAVPVGTVLAVSGKRVNSTGTSATNLVALRNV
jgi:hypothetical protein